jgi:copper chaperone CopZ
MSTTYTVQGMTCGGCAAKVSSAVDKVAGVTGSSVDLTTGALTVSGQGIDDLAVRTAITDAGYQVR